MELENTAYDFYFDETFHTRAITWKKDILNIQTEDDFYVGCYVGSAEWQNIIKKIEKIEKEYKAKMGIPEDKELKSTSLIKKTKIKNGISSIQEESIIFYRNLLTILDGKIKLHFTTLNKHEFLVRSILPSSTVFEDHGYSYYKTIYSLTKMIINYPEYKIENILVDKSSDRTKRRKIINILGKHKKKIENIKKKDAERELVTNLQEIFRVIPLRFNSWEKIPWDYQYVINPFRLYINELNINVKNLIIDNEEKTYKEAKKLLRTNVLSGDSKEYIQLRVSDWLACLYSRLILSFDNNYRDKNKDQISENLILVDDNFFRLTNSRIKLVKQMIRVFLEQQDSYWASSGTYYNDGVTNFYTYLRYLKWCMENDNIPNKEQYNEWQIIELNYQWHQASMK